MDYFFSQLILIGITVLLCVKFLEILESKKRRHAAKHKSEECFIVTRQKFLYFTDTYVKIIMKS